MKCSDCHILIPFNITSDEVGVKEHVACYLSGCHRFEGWPLTCKRACPTFARSEIVAGGLKIMSSWFLRKLKIVIRKIQNNAETQNVKRPWKTREKAVKNSWKGREKLPHVDRSGLGILEWDSIFSPVNVQSKLMCILCIWVYSEPPWTEVHVHSLSASGVTCLLLLSGAKIALGKNVPEKGRETAPILAACRL